MRILLLDKVFAGLRLVYSFTWLCLAPGLAHAQKPVKHALLIANTSYDPVKTGWKRISSVNDIPLIGSALKIQDFKEPNITVIEDVTAGQIISALKKLTDGIRPGDIVVIHYSGHGVQLEDDNDDEPDRLDEALVPIDAEYDPAMLKSGKYLRDDTLGEWIVRIRQKLGEQGHLLLILDSCHSGAASRGPVPVLVRGDKPPLTSPSFRAPVVPHTSATGLIEESTRSRGRGGNADGLSKFVLFAGASSDEPNFETYTNGKSVGSLSYAVSRVLSQMGPEDTYRQVFARIRAEMAISAPRQNPVMEGDGDYRFFGGELVRQSGYAEVEGWRPDGTVTLGAGSLAGVNLGDVYRLDSAGKVFDRNRQGLLEGEVTRVDYFSSVLTLKAPPQQRIRPRQYWAHRVYTSLSNTMINTMLALPVSAGMQYKAFLDSLKSWPFVRLVTVQDGPEVALVEDGPGLVIQLAGTDLPYLDMKPLNVRTASGIAEFKKALLAYAQSRFIKSVKLTSDLVRMELSLVRVEAEVRGGEEFDIKALYDSPADTVTRIFSESDQFLIKVRNTGKVAAYYNILAIQPDGKIVQTIPHRPDADIRSYRIGPGESKVLKDLLLDGFSAPYGTEMLKLFASERPLNLYPVIDAQENVASRGDGSSLEELLGGFYSSTRGPNLRSSGSGSTYEYVYTIVPPQ